MKRPQYFENPLRPYTKALLSAIPQPDPGYERKKRVTVYDPSMHRYETDKPTWLKIEPGHFVLANAAETALYKEHLGR